MLWMLTGSHRTSTTTFWQDDRHFIVQRAFAELSDGGGGYSEGQRKRLSLSHRLTGCSTFSMVNPVLNGRQQGLNFYWQWDCASGEGYETDVIPPPTPAYGYGVRHYLRSAAVHDRHWGFGKTHVLCCWQEPVRRKARTASFQSLTLS